MEHGIKEFLLHDDLQAKLAGLVSGLLEKLPKGTYAGTADDLHNDIVAISTGVQGVGATTSNSPTGTGVASWLFAGGGTYTNYGGLVIPANYVGFIIRSASDVYSYVGFELDLSLYSKKEDFEGTEFEVLTSEDIQVEDFNYSIDSIGTVTGTKTNGRLYPFIRVQNATEIKWVAKNGCPFVVLGGDETSVIALGVSGGAQSLLYRITNTDNLTLLGSIDIGGAINDVTCRATYKNGTYKIYANDTLRATVLSSDLSTYPEYLNPVLGLVIWDAFVSIPELTAIVNDRISYIENKTKSTLPNSFKGLKYTSLGDSIEAYCDTQELIIKTLEIGSFQNLAESGATLLNNGANSGCFKYLEVDADARLITCNLGTNDFGISLPLGALGDTVNGSFYGALKIITEGLIANHPLARIFFYTIQQRDFLGGGTGNVNGMTNLNGNTVEQFNDAIKIMCRKASIPVIDLYQDWGVSLQNIDYFTYDRLHPNKQGHNRRATVIINKIKQYGL